MFLCNKKLSVTPYLPRGYLNCLKLMVTFFLLIKDLQGVASLVFVASISLATWQNDLSAGNFSAKSQEKLCESQLCAVLTNSAQ